MPDTHHLGYFQATVAIRIITIDDEFIEDTPLPHPWYRSLGIDTIGQCTYFRPTIEVQNVKKLAEWCGNQFWAEDENVRVIKAILTMMRRIDNPPVGTSRITADSDHSHVVYMSPQHLEQVMVPAKQVTRK